MELFKNLKYGFVTALAVFSVGAAAAQPEYVPGEVLIIPDTSFQAASVQAKGMSVLKMHTGKTSFSKVKVKPGQTVEEAVLELNNTPGILHAEPNYIYHATAAPNDPSFANYWGLENTGQSVNGTLGTPGVDIGAVAAWDNLTDCSSIVVAVIDTGVDYNHPDLSSVIWSNRDEIAGNSTDDDGNGFVDDVRGWDFVQGDNDPMDFQYHGTHVAGTIGAVGNNSVGGTGVCWKSTIMPLRVLDSLGSGTTANIVAAVDYAVANGAKVINMSLGGGAASATFDTAIANANTAGVLVVAAAGNGGADGIGDDNDVTPHYPSSYNQPNIIAVAATDQDDALATFSNFGATSVDMAAPGVNIYSTTPPARTTVAGCSWNFDDNTLQGWSVGTYDLSVPAAVTNTVAVTNEDANSGSYSITDTPAANYGNNMQYEAWSPTCNLTGKQGAVLEMAFNLDTEPSNDGFYPAVLVGASATTLAGWAGNSGGWVSDSYDMMTWDNTSTARVGWVLSTNSSVVANGVHVDDVAVTIPGTLHIGSEYTFLAGTSMATPHVAGVAALLWAAQPNLTVAEIRTLVINSGDAVGGLSGVVASGKRLNLNNGMPTGLPSGLTATATSSTNVDLAWTDNTAAETAYEVWRDAGAGYSLVDTLAANSTSYSDASAPAETSLVYRVMAVEPTRTVASNTATDTTFPLAPTSLTATAASSSKINLTWTDNSAVEANYRVLRSISGGAYITVTALAANTTSYSDTGLTAETDYSYQVVVVDGDGNTSTSSVASATTPAAPSGGGGGGALGGLLLLMLLPVLYCRAAILCSRK